MASMQCYTYIEQWKCVFYLCCWYYVHKYTINSAEASSYVNALLSSAMGSTLAEGRTIEPRQLSRYTQWWPAHTTTVTPSNMLIFRIASPQFSHILDDTVKLFRIVCLQIINNVGMLRQFRLLCL